MLKKWSSCCVVLGVTLSTATSAFAAIPVDVRHQPVSMLQSLAATGPSMQQLSRNQDFNKTTHVRLRQVFSGYPVWGGDVVMHIPQGKSFSLTNMPASASMNGLIYKDLQKDLTNSPAYLFTQAQADKALQFAIQTYQKSGLVKGTAEQGKAKLMVFVDQENKAHWAFLVDFLVPAQGKPARPTYILDALNFTVYRNWDNIQTLDAVEGGGLGGNFKTGKQVYDGVNGDFPKLAMMRDAATKTCFLENDSVTVVNASKNDELIQFKCEEIDSKHNAVYWDGMSDFSNFGFSPGNDALYDGKVIKAMYQDWYNTPVLTENGKPMMLKMRVHDKSFVGRENAYWDGQQMTFGDGLFTFYPLVSLGVGAHEVSHGFTEQHSGLVYEGQSGGLNESFSDMAAQAAEFYSTGESSWQLGAEIFKAKDQSLRYMDEPTKDCKGRKPGNACSISNAKDYNNQLDVHFSSGVFNKAYYLIGTAKNWTAKKAFDVMVQANMNYWTPNSTFVEAACGVLKATADYKYDVDAVKQAFAGVGVDTSHCA